MFRLGTGNRRTLMDTTVKVNDAQKVVDYKKVVQAQYRRLMRGLKDIPQSGKEQVRRAFQVAKNAHEGVKRKSGEPYILHPLAVAHIVVFKMGFKDPLSVICSLLHDTVEDTNIELQFIERKFGREARYIIDGLTKISSSGVITEMNSQQAENFRKVLLTISDDIRVILIKLADRLHNMQTLGAMRPEKVLKIASETSYIYAPLAHRLGLYEIKTELEDLSFKFSEPHIYEILEEKLEIYKRDAHNYIKRFTQKVKDRLKQAQIKVKIKSRFKSIASIYAKMTRQEIPFEEVFDLYALRIIIQEVKPELEREMCWRAYSTITDTYTPNLKRIRDWITVPKENGYEALHITVMGPEAKWIEIQIRTDRMDTIAEKGVAAHWIYKENGQVQEDFLTDWIDQVRDILENPDLNALEALKHFKENLQPNDVFVFTPKGEMVRLPNQSVVLDFAFKIHTKIGETAIGAKVNHVVESLNYVLRPGDLVEILTSRKQNPKEEWLRIVRTPKAKESIKRSLQKQRKEIIEQGRRLFKWRASQYQVDEDHPFMKELLAYFHQPTKEEFFYHLGAHKIDTTMISDFITLKKKGEKIGEDLIPSWNMDQTQLKAKFNEIGVDADMLVVGKETKIEKYILAKCCNPLPGDDILAYDEDHRIVIHRTSCPRAISLMSSFGSRIIRAKWGEQDSSVTFLAAIKVTGLDKQGMLNDLIKIISLRMKLNIRKVTIESEEGLFEGLFKIYVHSTKQLEQLIDELETLPHVHKAVRADHNEEPFPVEMKVSRKRYLDS